MTQPTHILLAVCGGIAAYKSADLIRRLREIGADVKVVMTESAKQFITPLCLSYLSDHPVYSDCFDTNAVAENDHIALARWADHYLIAPATAETIAKLSCGMASDLVSILYLATTAPVTIAPAMNHAMWSHPATQHNVNVLKQRGVHCINPVEGLHACGEQGVGNMAGVVDIVAMLRKMLVGQSFDCRL